MAFGISSDTLESTEPATYIIILAQALRNGWRHSYCVLYPQKWCWLKLVVLSVQTTARSAGIVMSRRVRFVRRSHKTPIQTSHFKTNATNASV